MLALYLVLLGGKHDKANVEVHDVIPVVCTALTETYGYLEQQWFGKSQGLHVDGWMQINGVSYHNTDYRIVVKDYPPMDTDLNLYLINLGAYLPTQFGEIHKYVVVAGKNKADAKVQGKLAIEREWFKPHTDAIVDIDDCLALSTVQQQFIHLEEGTFSENIFTNDYIVITSKD